MERLGVETLTRPMRVVVPSRALRDHLLARLVERRGRSIAGLHCTTLFGLAIGLVDRADGPTRLHDGLGFMLARRYAQNEDWLGRSLAHLREGFHSVDGSVRDLLEAGIDPSHVEALEEALTVDGPAGDASNAEIERARALVRVAGRTLEELEALGAHSTATLLRRATELIGDDPQRALPTSALAVYGFSDAIGVATDLLSVLLDRFDGAMYVDRPADPAEPERPDAGNVFARRFIERIAAVARPEEPAAPQEPAPMTMFQAIGGEAEAREVAERCRSLLDRGCRPEGIAIVARRLEVHRTALRTHLGRLGVPFSAAGAPGPHGAHGRTVQALLHLLERRGASPVERWLDARAAPFPQINNFDLYLALSTIGAGRLEEVAGRPYDAVSRKGRYTLPVRRGFSDGDEEVYARHRKVPVSALKSAAESGGRLCAHFDRWRAETQLGDHLARFRDLLQDRLAWPPAGDLTRQVSNIADELARAVPVETEMTYDEFVDLVRPALERAGESRFGGRGAGVRVLEVVEARGLTFEHLFLIGLNRSVFPRIINEDPLLPDNLRAVLSRRGFGVLQDLPQKLSGYDEERYLFSQLVSAADRVTLSWQDVDDDNRQRTASPLVERLRWSPAGGGEDGPTTARPIYSEAAARAAATAGLDRPAFEAAVVAGIHGDRAHFGKILTVAADPGAATAIGPRPPRGLATSRRRILDELDPERGVPRGERARARLGPYFGFIGPVAATGDPRRREPVFVTTLESVAACSWRAFLERLLRLRPIPDPLEALPAVEPLYIGNLVHRVLERVVAEQLLHHPETLAEARTRPSNAAWPPPERLAEVLEQEAQRLVREEGFAFPGFARLLVEVVGPYLETARQVEWAALAAVPAAATELYGAVVIQDRAERDRQIGFKADRIDSSGALSLTDYKTGKPLGEQVKTEAARRRHFLAKVKAGQSLQAVAYAMAGGQPDDLGRYVYLKPDPEIEAERRIAQVSGGEEDFSQAFLDAARASLEAWDRGVFLPRLIEPHGDKEFAFCKSCRVAEACLRGDSGARARLREWVDGREVADTPTEPVERTLLSVWRLRDEKTDEKPWRGTR